MHHQPPTRKEGVMARRIGKETFLYDFEGGAVHILNSSAEFIWDLCNGQHTVDDMCKSLRKGFNISTDRNLLNEIEATLVVFHKKGLLH